MKLIAIGTRREIEAARGCGADLVFLGVPIEFQVTEPDRFRALKGNLYWFVNELGEPKPCYDYQTKTDNDRWHSGNYYPTWPDAKRMGDKVREILTKGA